jgi:hypothetical protein
MAFRRRPEKLARPPCRKMSYQDVTWYMGTVT